MQLSLFSAFFRPASEKLNNSPNFDWSPLKKHLPPSGFEIVLGQLSENPIQITIVKHRTTKTGDFRATFQGKPSRVTVNGNLNPYAFLITLIHELAHHYVWTCHEKKKKGPSLRRHKRPLPHGKEWKSAFRQLMQPYLFAGVFPPDLHHALNRYLENPKASSAADHHLSRILKLFDVPDNTVRLEELPTDAVFSLHGRRIFRKKEKIRTRYRCICMKTSRIYLVHAGAPVMPV